MADGTRGDDALRQWLVQYLITTLGCAPGDVDPDASLADIGLGSRDSVVLSGELSELTGRPVSPVEIWQHPSINALVGYLCDREPEVAPMPVAAPAGDDGAVAIIGMGCRFPGDISGPDDLWEFLCDGRSSITEVPGERWAPFDDGTPEVGDTLARTTRWGSYLSGIDQFDAEFFEITTREATRMDPQQRLLLEVAWEALEHAGVPATSLRRSPTGVFVGACVSEYGYLAADDLPGVDAWTNIGGALSIIANRLSYALDLRGPSVTVDTACSSSLVAVHLACQSLRSGESTVAIAGGVNLLLSPAIFQGFDQTGALSPTGACHAFDADADGFVRGEGCGVVVLKRLCDARRDGDPVVAVIRGSAVNQDGHSNGLLAPNPAAQMDVLRAAYANAGLSPRDVDYVEAHGTGTLLGDPIEARALGTVLGRGRAVDAPLLIGAVKSNLGHLEAAAGVVGLMKSVLAIRHGAIPANLHYRTPNPHIPFSALRLEVVAELRDWPATHRPRRAGVSSFGFGGTNAHIVLEQAPSFGGAPEAAPDDTITTLVVSGKTPGRVASLAGGLARWMAGTGADVPLRDVAHTLNHHRTPHPVFATVCARERDQAVAGLTALARGDGADGLVAPHDGPCGPGTVFVYSGQGSHWAGMGRRLLADEPAFASAVAEIEPDFIAQIGFSLQHVLESGQPVRGDAQVQPVLMGLQLALTALWGSHGVHPDAVIGHSMGEVTAAVVAGALTRAEGLRVIATRSTLMSRLAGQGAVALLRLDAESAAAHLADHPGVTVAVYSSPGQTVVAGPVAAVDAVIEDVLRAGKFARRVNMEVASHTALMDPILPELSSALADLAPRQPRVPFYSTVVDDTSPRLDGQYWVANLRQPVQLRRAFAAAAAEHTTFVEVSPHPTLTAAITETVEPLGHHHSVGTLTKDADDTWTFRTNLNAVHTHRPPQTTHPAEPHPVLPSTPWQHNAYWMRTRVTPPLASHSRVVPVVPVTDDGMPGGWLCELDWVATSAPAPDNAEDSWLVIGDPDLAAELRDSAGVASQVTALDDAPAGDADLAAALGAATRVVFAPAVDGDQTAAAAGYRLFDTARRLVSAAAAAPTAPRLHLVTRNAQPVADGDRANPAHAVLWGLGRTVALEHPEVWGGVTDVDDTVPATLCARYLLAEAGSDGTEDQVVYRAGTRHVPRLRYRSTPTGPAARLDGDGTHLVVGATGNIGPALIGQLAATGARTIVAVSRAPGGRLDDVTKTLAAQGVKLVTVAADAADRTAMTALFDRFGADLPALSGVYLAAFGGGPVTLADMSDTDVAAMFRPKLDAVAVLHTLSLRCPELRRFVMFSSISGLTGSRWLGHYAATTTFQDAFACARRAAGLPATAVNWGLWQSLAEHQGDLENQVTAGSGLRPMPDDTAIRALSWATRPDASARAIVADADWPRLAAAYRTRAPLRILDDLLGAVTDGQIPSGDTEFRDRLRRSAPDERHDLLTDHVSSLVAGVMGLESTRLLEPTTGFFQFGMDSLMTVTLQRALSETLGEPLPTSVVFDYPTVEALTGYLASTMPELTGVAEDADGADLADGLSEDELLQALSERLG